MLLLYISLIDSLQSIHLLTFVLEIAINLVPYDLLEAQIFTEEWHLIE